MFGHGTREYFEAEKGAEEPPPVKF
jgi:hypothetical protein